MLIVATENAPLLFVSEVTELSYVSSRGLRFVVNKRRHPPRSDMASNVLPTV